MKRLRLIILISLFSFWLTGLTDNSDLTIKEFKCYIYKVPE